MYVTNTVVCLLATMCAMSRTTDANCNKLNAAFEFRGDHFYLYGDGRMLGLDNRGNKVFRAFFFETQFDEHMTAAVGYSATSTLYQYSGESETVFPDFNNGEEMPLSYARGRLHSFLGQLAVSVDAAYLGHDYIITYFSGCDYLKIMFRPDQYIRVTDFGKNEDLGLPCDLDAAWSSSDHRVAYFVKGDQLYQISDNARATGPVSVVSIFPALGELNLCPSDA